MIGMNMCVYNLYQLEIQFFQQSEVVIGPFEDWVDHKCLATLSAGNEVGVG